jgi:hypothetical protein
MLEIPVTLLGRRVYCQHCRGGFVAADPAMSAAREHPRLDEVDKLIERAAFVLQQASAFGTEEDRG